MGRGNGRRRFDSAAYQQPGSVQDCHCEDDKFDIVHPEVASLAGDVDQERQGRQGQQERYGGPAVDGLNRPCGQFDEIRANKKDLDGSAKKREQQSAHDEKREIPLFAINPQACKQDG